MRKFNLICIYGFLIIFTACNSSNQQNKLKVKYPKTEKKVVVDEYFGVRVEDPFRWLEDDNSEETGKWVEEQNEVTNNYFSKIPFKDSVRSRLDKMANYERYGFPMKRADKYFYFRNSGLQNQSVLYVSDSKTDEGKVFLDPNTFSEDGTTAIGEFGFSQNDKYLGYTLSESGADWQKIVFIDINGNVLPDTIYDVKFTDIVWEGDEGIYYCRYNKPKEGSVLSAMTLHHKIYYHKLGTPQKDDKLIFGDDIKRRYLGSWVFKQSRFLFVSAAEGTSGNELYFSERKSSDNKFTAIVDNFENDHEVVYAKDNSFFILTNLNAPNKRIIKGNIKTPGYNSWETIIPESKETIESVTFSGGYFFVEYLENASSKVCQYDLEGDLIREVKLPGIGSTIIYAGKESDEELFYAFTSFNVPSSIYSYDIKTGESIVFRTPHLSIDLSQYITEQVFYESKDGTKVPMFIVHKKGIILDGKNPTLLYGYGGFNVSLTPSFSFRWIAWLDMGGVFAMANLRGGGEYGEKWHEAGMKMQKQNVFDDFIAGAEYLQKEKYTSPEKLAIMGGSNGGLLIGAVTNQRPELFKVALPAVGVMDMLRYHKFTAGAGWIPDYGCADSTKAMFEYLKAYSPVHNIKSGVDYPAILVTTADHDDRVVPAHSFKYIAQLQDKYKGDNPVLIRIETKAGHGAGKSTGKYLDELAEVYSFAFFNMEEVPEYFK